MPVTSRPVFAAHTAALAIEPAPERTPALGDSLQRVRFHSGRSLDHADLRLDASTAEMRFGLMSRVLADGIIDGFQVALADQDTQRGGFTLAPGYAIAPQGQDLTLNRRAQLRLADLPRRTGSQPNVTPPLAGICVLTLAPISAEDTRFASARDTSSAFLRDQQLDADAAPFQDARVVDGCRVELVRLEDITLNPADPNAMNASIAALAAAEYNSADMARFTQTSVALCLMGVAGNGRILWVHRHGAARRGGGVRRVLAARQNAPLHRPRLGQARVDALMETHALHRRAGRAFVASDYTDLPAAGVLPFILSADDLPFPRTWARDTVPIPMGQLDALFAQTEGLADYDLSVPVDEVRLYVPVPDALFEPGLLEDARISPAFTAARASFAQTLSDRLEMRNETLGRGEAVLLLLDADDRWATLQSYDPDPDAIEGEDSLPTPADADARNFNAEALPLYQTWRDAVPDTLLTQAQADLVEFSGDNRAQGKGLRAFVSALNTSLNAADDFIDFGFTKVQAEIYRLRQILLDTEEATKLATFPVLAGLAKGSNALAINKGLRENFAFVRAKALSAANLPVAAELRSLDRGFDTAMLLPLELDTPEAPFMLSGFGTGLTSTASKPGTNLAGTTVLSGPVGAAVSVTPRSGFGLVVGGQTSGPSPASATTTQPVTGVLDFAAPTLLSEVSVSESDAYRNIFNASRDIASDEIALSDTADKRAGITFASAIPGDYRDLRTVTIADRLAASAAQQARTSALRTKADTLAGVGDLDLALGGVKAPIMGLDAPIALITRGDFEKRTAPFATGDLAPTIDALRAGLSVLQTGETADLDVVQVTLSGLNVSDNAGHAKLARSLRRLHSPIAVPDMVNIVLGRLLDNDPAEGADESELLAGAVEILESCVSVFRAAERRVAALRGVLKSAEILIDALEALADQWRADIDAADVALSEARHDMQAVHALFEEESVRIDALNDTRQTILRTQVKFLVYARPRKLRPHSAGETSGRMLPGVFDDPLPLALERPVELPDDLDRMLGILRDMPIGWFAARDALLAGFGKPRVLDRTYHWAANAAAIRLNSRKTRAISAQLGTQVPVQATRGGKAARARKVAGQISSFYENLSARFLLARQQIDLGYVDRQDWKDKRAAAAQDLSLADVIEGSGTAKTAARALREMEEIERVIGSYYVLLRRVPAAVRLLWADKLSVFDGDPRLLEIERLPGWSALLPEARHDLRRLHVWLFARMQPGHAEARALMSDIIQVALLLAANADSGTVVKARIEDETTVDPGGSVDLALDLGQPEIGTPIWFGAVGQTRIPGTISNILKGRVQVTLSPALTGRVTLRPDMPVFVDAKRLSPARYGR